MNGNAHTASLPNGHSPGPHRFVLSGGTIHDPLQGRDGIVDEIWVENGNWVLTDLGSTNGTLSGGAPVSGTVSLHLDEPVTIGATTFELRRRI